MPNLPNGDHQSPYRHLFPRLTCPNPSCDGSDFCCPLELVCELYAGAPSCCDGGGGCTGYIPCSDPSTVPCGPDFCCPDLTCGLDSTGNPTCLSATPPPPDTATMLGITTIQSPDLPTSPALSSQNVGSSSNPATSPGAIAGYVLSAIVTFIVGLIGRNLAKEYCDSD